MSSRITAADIRVALHRWRPTKDGAYVILTEVRNGTGFARSKDRTADAMIFGMWPSRGLSIEGVEIKVSRSDWLKELADPTKADALSRFCHRWWVATVPNVIDPGELPPNWGHVEMRRGVLRVVSQPVDQEPEPIDPPMMASLLRNAMRSSASNQRRELAESYAAGVKATEDRLQHQTEVVEKAWADLADILGVDPRQDRRVLARVREGLEASAAAANARRDRMTIEGIARSARRIAEDADRLLSEPSEG